MSDAFEVASTLGGACCADDLLRAIRARFIRVSYAEHDAEVLGLEMDGMQDGSTGTGVVGGVASLLETSTSTPRANVTLLLRFALRRLLTHASVTASRQRILPGRGGGARGGCDSGGGQP